ncbi:MAG: AMP-dependent synthetase [Rhodospirillaceae bacterium]|nr:AMP-dependent synthetase [Rhodospirillaceae bacterium]
MNTTKRPASSTLGDLLDELVSLYSSKEFIIYQDQRVTYSDFKKKVDTLALSLIHLGIVAGDRVALLAPNRPEWLIATFAIAKIGGITTAISTFSTASELTWTLRHCGATCLITIPSFKGNDFLKTIKSLSTESPNESSRPLDIKQLPDLKFIISIDSVTENIALAWKDCFILSKNMSMNLLRNRQKNVSEGDLCYILYTSGSTAEPKGVTLAHGRVIANGYDIGERQNLNNRDRLWFAIPLFWSFGSANALPAIMSHGGCIVLQESFEPYAAIELIDREQCSVFYGMANMARSIRESSNWSTKRFSSMRTGLTIGLPEDIKMIIDTVGAKELCNVYGSTETYGNAAVCSSTDPIELRLNSQGLPLPGMKIRAVDLETRLPLPDGQIGELTVAGYVTPGYYGSPELTANTFDENGYFLTGDLGMVGTDGRIYFKGRLKEIIKTGGVNVSPLEVEKVLVQHPNIKQAFVFGIPDNQKDELVAAVIELKPGQREDALSIISFCRKDLASYKVPSLVSFKRNKDLPRTSTGKIHKPGLKQKFVEENYFNGIKS